MSDYLDETTARQHSLVSGVGQMVGHHGSPVLPAQFISKAANR